MFYDDLKKDLKELMTKKDYNKALELINQELAMPYVPNDIETYLIELKKDLLENQNFQTSATKQLTLQEIQTKLLSKDLLDQSVAIQNLETINVRPMLTILEQYLTDVQVLAANKTLVLMVLNQQQVDQPIKIQKNHELFQVVPKELPVDSVYLEFKQLTERLEQAIGDKNPSLLNNATHFGLIFLMNYFPQNLRFELNDFVAAVLGKSYLSLGLEINWDQLKQKFSFDLNTVQKILKDQEQYEQHQL